MELEVESEQLVPPFCQGIIDELGHRLVFYRDPAAIGLIEQAEDIKQCAFTTPGRADDGMHGPALELERHSAERVHAGIVVAQKTFDAFAAERNFGVHEF
jgi:hypothetical protein